MEKVAIILHGINSESSKMKNLTKALKSSITNELIGHRVYDRVVAYSLSLGHNVPRATVTVESEKVAKKIQRLISRKEIPPIIDVIGHSNGGYVACDLLNRIPDSINRIFTVSTPDWTFGLWSPTEVKIPIKRRKDIVHFYGDKDFLNKFGNSFAPAKGHKVFVFPDEGHSSIHDDSLTNGLAKIISMIATAQVPDYWYISADFKLHIWPWCRKECPTNKLLLSLGNLGPEPIHVCNGIHSSEYQEVVRTVDQLKNKIDRLVGIKTPAIISNAVSEIFGSAVLSYKMFQFYFNESSKLRDEYRSLKLILNQDEERLAALVATEKRIIKLSKQHLSNFKKKGNVILKKVGIKGKKVHSLYQFVSEVLKSNYIDDHAIAAITQALEYANTEYEAFQLTVNDLHSGQRTLIKGGQ